MKTPSLRIECAYCTQTLHFSSFCQSWRHCQCWSTLHPSLRHGTHGPSRNYCRHSCWTCFIVQGWETPWMHRWFHWHILFLSPIEMPLACVSDWPGKDCPAPPGSLGFLQCLCLSWMAHYWSQAKFRFGDFSWAVNGKCGCVFTFLEMSGVHYHGVWKVYASMDGPEPSWSRSILRPCRRCFFCEPKQKQSGFDQVTFDNRQFASVAFRGFDVKYDTMGTIYTREGWSF